MPEHKRDEWGYVQPDCLCEECYYYRLSYDLDTSGPWFSDAPGFAAVDREEDMLSAEEGIYNEALLALTGEETWKGNRTLRLSTIKVGKRYPIWDTGEVFLLGT